LDRCSPTAPVLSGVKDTEARTPVPVGVGGAPRSVKATTIVPFA